MKFLKVETFPDDPQMMIVCLNRPEVHNAFHPGMIEELTRTFKDLSAKPELKAVILTGEGATFCAGGDLNWMKEMIQYTLEENKKDSEKLWDMFAAIADCVAPVIGVVQGSAFGGALGLIAGCDYVIAAPKTVFCFSEVRLGLAPAVISSFVRRKVADGLARPYMLSAEPFALDVAIRMGLVHAVPAHFSDWKNEIKKFSVNGLEAMRETKKLLNQFNGGLSWGEQKSVTTAVISKLRVGSEAQGRLQRFLEKKV